MEVKVKLSLPDADAHSKVNTLLSPFSVETLNQENLFFNGSNNELSSKRAVLRLRFYNGNTRCVVALISKAVLVNGISNVEEDGENLDHEVGRECAVDPTKLSLVDQRVLQRCKEEFDVKDFVGLGGFANVRIVFDWKGLKLEIDETEYDFGTCYVIECETSNPEEARNLLEDFLKENTVEYKYSEASKFVVFRSGKLP